MRPAFPIMFGLNAPIYSDGCGLRPFFDGLAETLVAETFYATWNGEGMVYPPERTITRLLDIGFSTIIAAGHSHGAHALRTALLGAPARSVDLAIFFDPAPVGQPFLSFFSAERRELCRELPCSGQRWGLWTLWKNFDCDAGRGKTTSARPNATDYGIRSSWKRCAGKIGKCSLRKT